MEARHQDGRVRCARRACVEKRMDDWRRQRVYPGRRGVDADGGGVQGMCREDDADISTVGLEPTISALGGQRLIH